jgi:MFS transporter, DHA1 family, tetracycline resistance protein
VFGPLFFSFVYFQLRPVWPGLIWIVGAAIYLLALPLILNIRRSRPPAEPVAA